MKENENRLVFKYGLTNTELSNGGNSNTNNNNLLTFMK